MSTRHVFEDATSQLSTSIRMSYAKLVGRSGSLKTGRIEGVGVRGMNLLFEVRIRPRFGPNWIIVSAPSWIEAKLWAQREYGEKFQRIGEEISNIDPAFKEPDVVLEWRGSPLHCPPDLRIERVK